MRYFYYYFFSGLLSILILTGWMLEDYIKQNMYMSWIIVQYFIHGLDYSKYSIIYVFFWEKKTTECNFYLSYTNLFIEFWIGLCIGLNGINMILKSENIHFTP